MRSEFLLLLCAAIGLGLILSIRICRESERVAVHSPRRFIKFVGPGLYLTWPWQSPYDYTRVRISDTGYYIGNGWGKVHGKNVPVEAVNNLEVDQEFRVKNFVNQQVFVEPAGRKDGA